MFKPSADRFILRNGESYEYRDEFGNMAYGLQFGHTFANQWQLRSYYDRLNLNVRAGESDGQFEARGHSYGVDLIYQSQHGLYAGLGINSTRSNKQKDALPRATLGYRMDLKDRFFTTLEYNVQHDSDFTDQQISWTLNYHLGRDARQQMLPREFRERRARRAQSSGGNPSPPQ
ncbi:hypothetical protein CWE12_03525 [Aliidiomarina sedimenti]|uniref:Outer membrane protein beta-barrel domain-containing protein n=1 Tax=Aliidiomarina sedimenti TaxID=1933879 RepID=A0ABY0C2Q5_9GAMM|nr:hypothetical protein [Aliidiomarina sedimenti]RUO32071.1 hypothetical protein CWE12_03525 [Aliidiomarina sedimenti]